MIYLFLSKKCILTLQKRPRIHIPIATNAPNTISHQKESELLTEMADSRSGVRNSKINPGFIYLFTCLLTYLFFAILTRGYVYSFERETNIDVKKKNQSDAPPFAPQLGIEPET